MGAVLLVLSFGGFLARMYLGALLASDTVRGCTGHGQSRWPSAALGVAVASLGTAGHGDRRHGSSGRSTGGRLGPVDSALGMVMAVAAMLVTAWLVASTFVNSFVGGHRRSGRSRIVRALDGVLRRPRRVLPGPGFLTAKGFPPVFARLAPLSAGPVALPATPGAGGAGPPPASTVKVGATGAGTSRRAPASCGTGPGGDQRGRGGRIAHPWSRSQRDPGPRWCSSTPRSTWRSCGWPASPGPGLPLDPGGRSAGAPGRRARLPGGWSVHRWTPQG